MGLKDSLRNSLQTHNYIDIITGLLIFVFTLYFDDLGMIFLVFIGLHVFIRKGADEREQSLIAKAYAYAFHFLIALMAIFDICCPQIVTPWIVIGLSIFLRGFFGAIFLKFF